MQKDLSNNQCRIDQLELQLCQLDRVLLEHYCQTGKKILDLAEREEREINQLVDRMIELRKELSALKQEQCCPACALLNDSDSRYCKNCGHPLRTGHTDD